MSKITDFITEIALPVVERHGCELWDVEFVKEAGGRVLRIFIDRRGEGVSINHCEAISRELDPILDEHEDMFPGSYTFEVSSAGAERHLRRPTDFQRFLGHLVELNLYQARNSRKIYTGILKGYDDGNVELEVSGMTLCFTKAEIAGVRLRIS